MTPIKPEFHSRQFHHRLIKRLGLFCLFERWHQDLAMKDLHYEVVKLHQDDDREIHGKLVLAHERYPGAEEWGMRGFTYRSREDAEARFTAMAS